MVKQTKQTRKCKNVLLVEGDEDKRVIPQLMEANGIDWGKRGQEIIDIRAYDGYENLARPKEISTALKDDGLSTCAKLIIYSHRPKPLENLGSSWGKCINIFA